MAKAPKNIKIKVDAPSSAAGKVPKKGGASVAQESGSRNAPIINIGIDRQDRAAIAEGLSRVLADTYTL
ncbi:MAG: DNA starvation/stationary phase protection protein, partial [Comamonadaceae bacterium]